MKSHLKPQCFHEHVTRSWKCLSHMSKLLNFIFHGSTEVSDDDCASFWCTAK